jgi:hypothetical protein
VNACNDSEGRICWLKSLLLEPKISLLILLTDLISKTINGFRGRQFALLFDIESLGGSMG